MLIYILIFIFLSILSVEYDLISFNRKSPLIIIILLLALLAGLRDIGVARDYKNYQMIFDLIYDLVTKNDGVFLPIFEPGFMAIVVLFRYMFIYNYGVAIMLFFAFSSITLKVISFDKFAINPFLAILFYFSNYYVLHEMTQIRVGFASALFLISLIYLLKGNHTKFILLILLATLFHYTSILYLLILLFNKNSLNKYLYTGFIILAIIFAFYPLPLLNVVSIFDPATVSGKLTNYVSISEKGLSDKINIFNTIAICNFLCCIYYLFGIPLKDLLEDKLTLLFIKLNIISLLFSSIFVAVPALSFRLSQLFAVGSIFLFSNLIKYLPFKKLNIVFLIVLAGLFFYLNVFHEGLLTEYKIVRFR